MAKVKIEKGSMVWRMFSDFYLLCQNYWEPEKTDDWWREVTDKANRFAEKYKDVFLGRFLAMALILYLEDKERRCSQFADDRRRDSAAV